MLSLMRRSLVDLGSYRWLVARGRWLVARGRWLVTGGRWLVTGGRWLVTGGRWLVTGGRRLVTGSRWLVARAPLCDLMFFLNTCLLLLLSLLIFLVLRRPVDTTGGVDWCRGAIADGRGRLVNGGWRAAIARALGDIDGRLGLGLVEDLSSSVGLPLHDVVLLLAIFLSTFLVLLLLSLLTFLVLRRPVDPIGAIDWCRGAVAGALGGEGGGRGVVGGGGGGVVGGRGVVGGGCRLEGNRLGLVEDLSSSIGLPLHDVVLLFFLLVLGHLPPLDGLGVADLLALLLALLPALLVVLRVALHFVVINLRTLIPEDSLAVLLRVLLALRGVGGLALLLLHR